MRKMFVPLLAAALILCMNIPAAAGEPPSDLLTVAQGDQGKFGYKNELGDWVIDPQYLVAQPFSEGFAVVTADGGEGIIDSSGNWLVEPSSRDYQGFFGGLCFFFEKGQLNRTGAVDASGRVALTAPENSAFESGAQNSENGLYPFFTMIDGKRKAGYVNRRGEIVIPPNYQTARPFCNGAAPVCVYSGGGVIGGVIDVNGDWIVEPQFAVIGDYHDGICCVIDRYAPDDPALIGHDQRQRRLIDTKGKVIPVPVDAVISDIIFSDGLAAAKSTAGLYGYIDKTGHWAVPPSFALKPGDFQNGFAVLRGASPLYVGDAVIDKTGKIIYKIDTAGTFWGRAGDDLLMFRDGYLWIDSLTGKPLVQVGGPFEEPPFNAFEWAALRPIDKNSNVWYSETSQGIIPNCEGRVFVGAGRRIASTLFVFLEVIPMCV